jgi:RNA polymerase sigma-70 factor, ECF subfamily
MLQPYAHECRHQAGRNRVIRPAVLPRRGASTFTPHEKSARFKLLLEPHLDAAYNFARWLARNDDDAQDVAHDALLRALEYFDTFKGEQIRPWLLRIVRNTFFTWRKKSRPVQKLEVFDEEAHGAPRPEVDPQALVLRNADRRALAAAIESLPRKYRESIILREIEDLSYKELAALLDIPIGTVMSRLAVARKRLEEILKGQNSGKTYESSF